MKVIELLNKIANGEEVPKKIKYINSIWEYDKETKDYFHDDLWLIYSMNSIGLTEREIEIIEEPQEHKIPEKLENEKNFYAYTRYEENKDEIDKVLYILKALNLVEEKIDNLNNKINEIIDYINKENKCKIEKKN